MGGCGRRGRSGLLRRAEPVLEARQRGARAGVVHERAGDDGSKAVHSGSCRGALWWPLWYSSVAGQLGDATGAVS